MFFELNALNLLFLSLLLLFRVPPPFKSHKSALLSIDLVLLGLPYLLLLSSLHLHLFLLGLFLSLSHPLYFQLTGLFELLNLGQFLLVVCKCFCLHFSLTLLLDLVLVSHDGILRGDGLLFSHLLDPNIPL